MLTEYEIEQPICIKILNKSIKNKAYSHAYLFETNGYNKSFDLVLAFVKAIFCDDNNNIESISNKINKNIFSELEIINPDGYWIKKEQIDTLQHKFKNKSLEANRKVYIINQVERLNISAANTILKFLEEPEDNIIAILITENIYQVLETIKSRCQLVSLNKNKLKATDNTLINLSNVLCKNKEEQSLFLNDKINEEKINGVINFIKFYEKNKKETILYTEKLWHSFIKTKEDYLLAFDLLIRFYEEVLNYKNLKQINFFTQQIELIEEVSKNLNIDKIIFKLSIILELKEKIKYNINNSLLLDKLIIDMGD